MAMEDFWVFLTSLLFPLFYVLPLYVLPGNGGGSRRSKSVMRQRILITSLYVPLVFWIPAFVQLTTGSKGCFEEYKSVLPTSNSRILCGLLGLPMSGAVGHYYTAILVGIGPILILFVGSILTILLEGKTNCFKRDSIEAWIRDIVVAPCAEELYFRSGLMSFLYLNKVETKSLLLLSPMLFGVSHVHHMYDNIVHRRLSVRHAVIVAVVQFTYTYLFGCLAAFLLFKTGHIVAPVSAHALCNFFGVPRFGEITGYKYSTVIWIAHVFGVVGSASVIAWMAWDSRLGYVSMNPMSC